MFDYESSEDVLKLIKQEEERLKKRVPSFLQETVKSSPSKLFSDYTKTQDPVFKQAAGDSLKHLREVSDKSQTSITKESLAGLGLIGFAGLATPKGRSILGKTIVRGAKEIADNAVSKAGKKAVTLAEDKTIFKGFKDLTTKFLDYAKGKTTLSRQEIIDFARRPELKKGEADLLNRLAKDLPDGKLPAQDFADSIRRDLLELKPITLKEGKLRSVDEYRIGNAGSFKSITIDARQGTKTGKNYEEVVFESPITTNGSSHFPNSKNYFAHARGDEVVEGGKKVWREQEIQSDLLQKDKMEMTFGDEENLGKLQKQYISIGETDNANEIITRLKNKAQLDPFTNDRFGERIMRERIREKAQKGYSKYRLPTGETIGKIEGFEAPRWSFMTRNESRASGWDTVLASEKNLKIGKEITNESNSSKWIITDILGDGRFKAISKGAYESIKAGRWGKDIENQLTRNSETFDLTGKSNPQYRRYENWGKFLKNKYGGKVVTDPQGNTWVEIDLKPEYATDPVPAFGKAQLGTILTGAGATAGIASMFQTDDTTHEIGDRPRVIAEEEPEQRTQTFDREEFSHRIVNKTENRGTPQEKLYSIVGITGDLGKYQANPQTVKEWSESWLGKKYTPQQFLNDPEAQEEFFSQFQDVAERLDLTLEEAAVAWHTGWGELGTGPRETRDERFLAKLRTKMNSQIGKRYRSIFNE